MRGLTSVVIPARKAAEFLPAQLEALAAQDYAGDWEVVVADHRSSDGTADAARSLADRLPSLQVVRVDRRGGANIARNEGAHHARGELLAFCDADDVVAPGWLSAMVGAAENADIVGGTLETTRLNRGPASGWRGSDHTTIDTTSGARLGFLPYAAAGNVAIWANVFAQLGGFPEEYRKGCDEVALCWRAQLGGFRLTPAPGATIHYRFRTHVLAMVRQHYRYGCMEPKLYREFRTLGMPRSDTRAALGHLRALLAQAPAAILARRSRGTWARLTAVQAGHVVGSVRNRVVFL